MTSTQTKPGQTLQDLSGSSERVETKDGLPPLAHVDVCSDNAQLIWHRVRCHRKDEHISTPRVPRKEKKDYLQFIEKISLFKGFTQFQK